MQPCVLQLQMRVRFLHCNLQAQLANSRWPQTLYKMQDDLVKVREKLSKVVAKIKDGEKTLSKKQEEKISEITLTKLIPPAVFGESAITDPYFGIEPASIIAETRVEVLSLRTKVIPSEKITEAFTRSVRLRALRYRKAKEINDRNWSETKWSSFKKEQMLRIPKYKWPVDKNKIRYLGGGREKIID